MEVFRPKNVYADLNSVCIDLQMSLLRNMRHSGDGQLPQDVPSRRTNLQLTNVVMSQLVTIETAFLKFSLSLSFRFHWW